MDVKRQRLGYGTLVVWLLSMLAIGPVALAGIVVAYLVDVTIIGIFDVWNGFLSFLLILIGGVIAGSMVGFIQSLALRHAVPWAGKWVKATSVGWAIAGVFWAVSFLALGGTHFEVSSKDLFIVIPLIGTITGLGIGVGQWLMMRRWVKMPFWWIATTTLAWFLGGVVAYAGGYIVLAIPVAASIIAVITVIAMKAFIDSLTPKEKVPSG